MSTDTSKGEDDGELKRREECTLGGGEDGIRPSFVWKKSFSSLTSACLYRLSFSVSQVPQQFDHKPLCLGVFDSNLSGRSEFLSCGEDLSQMMMVDVRQSATS